MHVLVHGAGRAAVLRAAEAPGLEQGSGEFAHTGLVVELPAGADGAALHVLAGELAGKARVLSLEEKEEGIPIVKANSDMQILSK